MQSKPENIMILNRLIWPYKARRESGLLSVKVDGYEHLVKIYFELGMVVGLSMGIMKNEACLEILSQCRPLSSTFIKDYKTPAFAVADKEAAGRLEDLFTIYPVTGTKSDSKTASLASVSSDNLLKLETDYIDMIGPIGKMLVDSFYNDCGYKRGQDMPALIYTQLIERLKEELPDEYQTSFAAKYAIGMAL
jgi:hypothetical protein